VNDAVARQLRAGIDIVSDGEMGKVGFANYLSQRLEGFGGAAPAFRPADLADYPELSERRAGPRPRRPACNGPIRYRDVDGPRGDARLPVAAARTHTV
jgi:5-methyltetrahydropteroyltriglutamate--homocysteine methyltransferase